MSRALNSVFLTIWWHHNKSNMVEGCHVEKSLYFHISAANRPNMTKFGMQMQILTQAMDTWENFRNSQIQDSGRTPYSESFSGYNSAPYCPIKTKFGMRKNNCTHTKVSWWKRSNFENPTWRTAAILKISPYHSCKSSEFDEIWYAIANFDQGDGNVTSSQIHKFKVSDEHHIENHFLAIIELHIVQLRWNLEWGGRITRIRSRSGDKKMTNYENPK